VKARCRDGTVFINNRFGLGNSDCAEASPVSSVGQACGSSAANGRTRSRAKVFISSIDPEGPVIAFASAYNR
jgi:hypothetical protein